MDKQSAQSRIGKLPVPIPKGVEVTVANNEVKVKGPKGTLTQTYLDKVTIKIEDGNVIVATGGGDRKNKAFQGLYRSLVANMVKGVTDGFTKRLTIEGVGYRCAKQGNDVKFNLGYSHDVVFITPQGIEIDVEPSGRAVLIKGSDRQVVGQVAANIRALRAVEPYKGKGVRYEGERVVLKEGKAGKSGKK